MERHCGGLLSLHGSIHELTGISFIITSIRFTLLTLASYWAAKVDAGGVGISRIRNTTKWSSTRRCNPACSMCSWCATDLRYDVTHELLTGNATPLEPKCITHYDMIFECVLQQKSQRLRRGHHYPGSS